MLGRIYSQRASRLSSTSHHCNPLKPGKYAIFSGVRVRRIELLPQAWEAHVLPLNYTRVTPDPENPCIP